MLLVNNTASVIEDTGIVTQYTYTGSTAILPTFTNVTNMMYNIQSSCVVTVPSNFGKTESDCNFVGTFTVV